MADIYVSKPFVKKGEKQEEDAFLDKKENLTKKKRPIPFKERKSLDFNPVASFSFLPKGVDFETKNKGEKVVLLLRRHPITNLRWIFLAILMSFAPLLLASFPIIDFLPSNFRFVAILGWYMITLAFVFESFLSWFFNVNIVTDERIVDIDFVNLIYKEISDADIDKIQDVTVKVGGVAQTMFNYGDVYIQTASEKPRFEFLSVPKPEDVAKILQELRIEEKQEELEGRVS
jgi:membrane protein YdbS with pleckstrin-like domain